MDTDWVQIAADLEAERSLGQARVERKSSGHSWFVVEQAWPHAGCRGHVVPVAVDNVLAVVIQSSDMDSIAVEAMLVPGTAQHSLLAGSLPMGILPSET